MTEYLSEHFTLAEMIASDTAKARGINNVPTTYHKKLLKHTCEYLLERIRKCLNEKYKEYRGRKVKEVTMKVTSGYRSVLLNSAVGGSNISQHCRGEAADIEATIVYTNGTRITLPYKELYENIKLWTIEGKVVVDQCIQERSGNVVWVHVSLPPQIKDSRKMFMKYDRGMYNLDCILR